MNLKQIQFIEHNQMRVVDDVADEFVVSEFMYDYRFAFSSLNTRVSRYFNSSRVI